MFVSQPLPKVMIMTLLESLNPHLPNGLQLDESIFHLRVVWCTFFIFFYLFAYVPKMGCQYSMYL